MNATEQLFQSRQIVQALNGCGRLGIWNAEGVLTPLSQQFFCLGQSAFTPPFRKPLLQSFLSSFFENGLIR